MRVLWVTNVVFPLVTGRLSLRGSASGGWLYHLADRLSDMDTIDLCVASAYIGKETILLKEHGIDFYLFPMSRIEFLFGTRKNNHMIRHMVETFHPDLIHIHGAELPFGINFVKLFSNHKIVLNIQTLSVPLYKEQFAGMRFADLWMNRCIWETFTLKGPVMRIIYAAFRVNLEKKYFKSIPYIIGSTLWDKAYLTCNTTFKAYFCCPYLFRKEFYDRENRWSLSEMERHSIMTGQAVEPFKGLHVLIKALYYVKKKVADVKLYIPGPDLLSACCLKRYGYAKYIQKLIHRLDLRASVIFTGPLDASKMAQRMKHSNVVVVPSAVELGSSTLCEAMLLGVPVISSFRGGMTESFEHGKSGYFYDFNEKYLLATYLLKIFNNDALAEELSHNAQIAAMKVHDPAICTNTVLSAYEHIVTETESK